jgi:hypothetical protein
MVKACRRRHGVRAVVQHVDDGVWCTSTRSLVKWEREGEPSTKSLRSVSTSSPPLRTESPIGNRVMGCPSATIGRSPPRPCAESEHVLGGLSKFGLKLTVRIRIASNIRDRLVPKRAPPQSSENSAQAHTRRASPDSHHSQLDTPEEGCHQPRPRDLPAPPAAGNINTATTSADTKRPVSFRAESNWSGGLYLTLSDPLS